MIPISNFNSKRKLLLVVFFIIVSILNLIYAMVTSQQFGHLTPDAISTYLPLANKFIEEPLSIWKDPLAITVAPGGYVYMAIMGAKPERIFILNILIAVISLLLIFDICRRIAGFIAGISAALIYSFSPLLIDIIVPVLNEPPYLFFTTLWIWSTVLIQDLPNKKWPIIIAGLALLFSILTRALYFYWLFPAIITCALIFLFSKKHDIKKLSLGILLSHLIALTGAGLYTLHNLNTHDTAMIATGSGTALYFGSNPVTWGYEPPYLNMLHDEWMLLDGVNSHLMPKNDQRLNFAAKQMISDMPIENLLSLYTNKLGAILFFSQSNLQPNILNERAFRIILIIFALIGFIANRKKLLVLMLFFAVLYLTAVHIPAMYNQRYSIGALDLPLTILAALGTTFIVKKHKDIKLILLFSVASILSILLGAIHQRYSSPLMPEIHKGVSHLALSAPINSIYFKDMSNNPLLESATILEKQSSIIWKNISNKKRGGTPIISMDIAEMSQDCKRIEFIYTGNDNRTWKSTLSLKKPKAPLQLTFGSLFLDNIDQLDSQLEIKFRCPLNSKIKINNLSLYVVQTGLYYRKQLPSELSVD